MPATTRPKFEGVAIVLAGTEYTVPALGIRDVKRLLPMVQRMKLEDGAPKEEFLDDACALIVVALRRNYPDMTDDEIIDLLDVTNLKPVLAAVLQASGFVVVPVADGTEGNGSEAPQPSTIGTPSTPDAAPPSAATGSTSTST